MRKIRAIALALVLVMPVAGMVVLPGCATVSGIFQSDPVGASLLTMKDAYEASVHTAGRLYVQKVISEAQLRAFRDKANKFYTSYNIIVALHAETKLTENDARFKNLVAAFDALQALVATFTKGV